MSTWREVISNGTVWSGLESSWPRSASWWSRPSTSTQSSWGRPRTRTGRCSEKAPPTSSQPSNVLLLSFIFIFLWVWAVTCVTDSQTKLIISYYPDLRQSLSLIMVTMMAGISQFVIHILLPSTDNVTRLVTLWRQNAEYCWTQDSNLNINWPVWTCPRDNGNSLNELSKVIIQIKF